MTTLEDKSIWEDAEVNFMWIFFDGFTFLIIHEGACE